MLYSATTLYYPRCFKIFHIKALIFQAMHLSHGLKTQTKSYVSLKSTGATFGNQLRTNGTLYPWLGGGQGHTSQMKILKALTDSRTHETVCLVPTLVSNHVVLHFSLFLSYMSLRNYQTWLPLRARLHP